MKKHNAKKLNLSLQTIKDLSAVTNVGGAGISKLTTIGKTWSFKCVVETQSQAQRCC